MPNIEINTAQNVTIQYELATLKDRILAFLLDFLIIIAGMFILGLIFVFALGPAFEYAWYFILIPILLFYAPVSEIVSNGQSVGKMALQIKVVKLTGKQPSTGDYLLRWVFRLIDIYLSFGSVASMLISSSSKGQRMGDMLANTALIKSRPTMNMTLADLMNISTIETYEPKYPLVRRLSEEDMLLVKTVIERTRKYPNEAHMEALDMMVKYMMEQLGVTTVPINKTEFLRTVLRDYIVLTR
jgi:uncharacterized RDD family membrane protein YckC